MIRTLGFYLAGQGSIPWWDFYSILADFQISPNFKDILLLSPNDRKNETFPHKSRGSKVSLGMEPDCGPSWPFEIK